LKGYIDWLYTGTFCTEESDDGSESEYLTLAELFGLGMNVEDAFFRNMVINAVVDKMREEQTLTGGECIEYVFDRQDVELNRLIVDAYARNAKTEHVVDGLHQAFREELLEALLESRKPEPLDLWDKCKYHNHGEGIARCDVEERAGSEGGSSELDTRLPIHQAN
jgi:hypothetical protein